MVVYDHAMNVDDLIKKLDLVPLPEEGGFFRETYRDRGLIAQGSHSYSTCIYYLITQEEFSGLHAVTSTEIFHFYSGDPVEMVQITPDGNLSKIRLGSILQPGCSPQVVVEANIWQGTRLVGNGEWALLGCTVAPGFEYSDFTGGTFSELSTMFPSHREVIRDFTHE